MAKPWCVLDREWLWHVTRSQLDPSPDRIVHNAPVICGGVVVLPWGLERRQPTCPACKTKRGEGKP